MNTKAISAPPSLPWSKVNWGWANPNLMQLLLGSPQNQSFQVRKQSLKEAGAWKMPENQFGET